MSLPLIRDQDPRPSAKTAAASIALFALWVSIPAVATYLAAEYFMELGYAGYEAQAAPRVLVWYGALVVLVAVTGIVGRHGRVLLDFRALIVAVEFVFVAIGALVILPELELDRHPFLPADAPLLPPLSSVEVTRIWISAVLAMYAMLIAVVITVLQLVARAKDWPGRREGKVIYITFAAMLLLGFLLTALLYVLRGHL
jgi:amino acid transporter